MKKIISVIITFFLFSSIVYAAGVNGNFKGNPIVIVKSNGKELKSGKTPAIYYNGTQLIPIDMLKQIGINSSWDAKKYSVELKQTSNTDDIVLSKKKFSEMQSKITKYGALSFTFSYAGGKQPFAEVFYYSKNVNALDDIPNIANISKVFLEIDIGVVQVGYFVNNVETETIYILRKDIEEYKSGKTDLTSFLNKWTIINNRQKDNSSSISGLTYPELYSSDGKTYLGKLTTNTYDSDSIYNEYGDYGSKYQSTSIWNEYGDYGGKYSSTSSFNKYATDPPIIVLDGKIVGYLTINTTIKNSISPYELMKWLKDQGY